MGNQGSSAGGGRGGRGGRGGAGGGRDDSFGKEGNYWENDDDDGLGGDHGLLEVSAAETEGWRQKLKEIQQRNAEVDGPSKMVDLRSHLSRDHIDTSKRMAQLRVDHQQRLVDWETEQQRKCAHCGKTIEGEISKYVGNEMYVHTECYDDYKVSIAPECAHCHEKVVRVEGKFSGNRVKAQDGSEVHVECQEAYLLAMGEPCAQCGERLAGECECPLPPLCPDPRAARALTRGSPCVPNTRS